MGKIRDVIQVIVDGIKHTVGVAGAISIVGIIAVAFSWPLWAIVILVAM